MWKDRLRPRPESNTKREVAKRARVAVPLHAPATPLAVDNESGSGTSLSDDEHESGSDDEDESGSDDEPESGSDDEHEGGSDEARYVQSLASPERRRYNELRTQLFEHATGAGNLPPLVSRVVWLPLPVHVKSLVQRRVLALLRMDGDASERAKLQDWVDTVLRLPLGRYKPLAFRIEDQTTEGARAFLQKVRNTMGVVCGLDNAKRDILLLVAQWLRNPGSGGQSLGIVGAPGTGKTTLVRRGIAEALGLPFFQISLGGMSDGSVLLGHSYTYEGARPGRITCMLQEARCMNPVIFFDELDKVSDSAGGRDLINALVHITDSSQNMAFVDKYLEGIPIDLSQALFIFSFNDKHRVDPILLDRMRVIHAPAPTPSEKVDIARHSLVPETLRTCGLPDVHFTDELLSYLVQRASCNEKGVRNLKRVILAMIRELNYQSLLEGSVQQPTPTLADRCIAQVADTAGTMPWQHIYT